MRPLSSLLRAPSALAVLAVAGAAAVFPATAGAAAFVPPGLLEGAAANPAETVHVIVVADPGISTDELKNGALKDRTGNQFGRLRREFTHLSTLALDVTGAELVELAAKDGIRSITPDGEVQEDSFTDPAWRSTVGFDLLPPLPRRVTTSMPTIAVVDSGVADLPDFGGRVTDRVNLSSFRTSDSGSDDYGHGTLVAGIAAGAEGAAPRAKIASVRVINGRGHSITSDVLAAANWIYENRVSKGIRVANFSIRSTHSNYAMYDPINLAVERLWHGGVVVVASAGNSGPERMLYAPASDPFVITVGAVDTNGTVAGGDDVNAPWSSYGYTSEGFAKPELAAPGRYMAGPVPPASTLASTFPLRVLAPGRMWMSGTSFSAPVVAGAAAELLVRHPSWSPDQVKGALMLTARPLPLAAPLSAGVGEIDVAAADAVLNPPNPNEGLNAFVKRDVRGEPYFDGDAWSAHVTADATWTSATWTSATWTSATWTSATWTSATWTSASWVSGAQADATWADATWTSATWTSATWTSATWTSATWVSGSAAE
jgi:serine protease AprX